MTKYSLLFSLAVSIILSSCIGDDDTVYTRDLDVVYTQKKEGYDFDKGNYNVAKKYFIVSDTLFYTDEKGDDYKIPGDRNDDISEQDVIALKQSIEQNMLSLGWTQLDPNIDPSEDQIKAAVFLVITASRVKYVGGGYYPGYPNWGWGYPGYGGGWGWYPWIPYYYSYETASVAVSMIEPFIEAAREDESGQLIWESFLSGYLTSSFDLQLVSQGIYQGFDQSSEYLDRN